MPENKNKKSGGERSLIKRTGEASSGEINEQTLTALQESENKVRIKEEKDRRKGKLKKEDNPGEKKIRKREGEDAALQNDVIYRMRGRVDRPMLILILVLICFGSVMVFSASYAYALNKFGDSYYYVKRQLLFVTVGIGLMIGISFIDYNKIKRYSPLFFGVSLAFLVAVLGLGVAAGVAKRWIDVGPFTIQPSEIMKLGLVLMLAWYYSKVGDKARVGGFWKTSAIGTFAPFGIVLAVAGLVALEKHLSGTIIMFIIGMIVVWCAGGKPVWFILGIGGFSAAVVWFVNNVEYATRRVDIWLHPENYSVQSEVWQTLQGMYAVGSGGFFGVGLGNSRQKHLFVSQPQNDFIFSILCEELGMIGALCVIALFVAFLIRGIVIAKRAPDVFSKLTAIGIVSKVIVQAFLNIAVVTNTIPNTGISLPFFSYGGSALIILFVEMGVLLSISRYSKLQNG